MAETVCVVTDRAPGLGAMHGLAKLRQAVEAAGSEYAQVTSWSKVEGDLCIVAGLADGGGIATAIHKDLSIVEPSGPESLLIRHVKYQGRKVLLVSGADDRGLMYALLALADKAGRAIGADRNKEFDSTMVDLRILAHLASYHSYRAKAGYHYALFKRSGDINAFDDAVAQETEAVEAWERLVASAGDVYTDDLMMGRPSAGLSGHWKDELVELREGLANLKKQRDGFTRGEAKGLSIAHAPLRKVRPDTHMQVRATVASNEDIKGVKLVYSSRGKEQAVTMLPAGPMCYTARIAARDVKAGLHYYIAATDAGRATAKTPTVSVIVSNDDTPPAVAHTPITTARPLKPLKITAEVQDASGVKWVRLRCRTVNQTQDYETLYMTPGDSTGVYECTVPAEKVDPQWDFMYFIEVMDNAGNGRIYPDLEKEAPYVIVRLRR